MSSGPTIGCPECDAQLPLRSVVQRGGRRYIECAECGEVTEWPVDDDRPAPRRRPPTV